MKWIVLGLMLLSTPALADRNIWSDMTKPSRDESVMQEAARACDLKVGPDRDGRPTKAAYKKCMKGYGWRFQKTIKER